MKYNHSKWMTILGALGHSRAASYETFSGSANWANLAFGDDEQMQRISNRHEALRHNATFAKTWRQESSSRAHGSAGGRVRARHPGGQPYGPGRAGHALRRSARASSAT